MSFKDIVGQEKAVNILLKSLKEDKVSPSYIFVGSEGVGKKFTAVEFAKTINCLNVNNNLEACEICNVCNKINKQCCPDLKIIEPIKGSIKIEQIRELRREIDLKPFEDRKKIYIIDQAEEMTIEASNCLLDSSKIRKILFNKVNLEESKAELVSKLAQGSIGKAFKLISDKEYFNRREKLLDYLNKVLPGKYDSNFFINIEKILMDINNIEEMLEIILLWYRDILIIKELGIKEYIINSDKIEVLKEKSRVYSKEMLIDILDYIEQIKEFMKKNINRRLVSERLYLKMVGVEYCLR